MVSIYIQKNKHQYDFAVLLLHVFTSWADEVS